MSITLTQSLRESEILKLKPNPTSKFKNYDFVTFINSDNKKKYCQLTYNEVVCAFIVSYFTNSNFNEKELNENGQETFSFVYQIGLSNLKLV